MGATSDFAYQKGRSHSRIALWHCRVGQPRAQQCPKRDLRCSSLLDTFQRIFCRLTGFAPHAKNSTETVKLINQLETNSPFRQRNSANGDPGCFRFRCAGLHHAVIRGCSIRRTRGARLKRSRPPQLGRLGISKLEHRPAGAGTCFWRACFAPPQAAPPSR